MQYHASPDGGGEWKAPPPLYEPDSENDWSKSRVAPPAYDKPSGALDVKTVPQPKVRAPAPRRWVMPSVGVGCIDACKRSPHLKSWTLTLTMVTVLTLLLLSLVGVMQIGRNALIVVVGVTACLYLFEMFCSSSFSYLTQTHHKDAVGVIVKRMKAATPSVKWHIQCYHYETKVRWTTDEEGRRKKNTTRERRNTWRATGYFQFDTWSDITKPLTGMDQYRLTKLKVEKRFTFGNNATRNQFNSQKVFFRESNDRDTHMDFTETFIVPGFESRILCEAVEGYRPWCLNWGFYLLFHFMFLGPCYRWWFSSICGKKELDIVKVLSCNSAGAV